MRRRPGQPETSAGVIARATLGAAGVVAGLAGLGALALPSHRLAILAGGAIAVLINLVTFACSWLASRYFAGALGAAMVGAYVAKLMAFGAALLMLRGTGLDLRVVVGIFVIALVISLVVYSLAALHRAGPQVGGP